MIVAGARRCAVSSLINSRSEPPRTPPRRWTFQSIDRLILEFINPNRRAYRCSGAGRRRRTYAIMRSHNKGIESLQEICDDADLARGHGPGP
jgi:hypothetical protein